MKHSGNMDTSRIRSGQMEAGCVICCDQDCILEVPDDILLACLCMTALFILRPLSTGRYIAKGLLHVEMR